MPAITAANTNIPTVVIGAKGADFLTWSCLHHLSETYGDLFTPTPELVERTLLLEKAHHPRPKLCGGGVL